MHAELFVAALGMLKHGGVLSPLFAAFGPDPVRERLVLGDAVVSGGNLRDAFSPDSIDPPSTPPGAALGGVVVSDRVRRIAEEHAARLLRLAVHRDGVLHAVVAAWPADPARRTAAQWQALWAVAPDGVSTG